MDRAQFSSEVANMNPTFPTLLGFGLGWWQSELKYLYHLGRAFASKQPINNYFCRWYMKTVTFVEILITLSGKCKHGCWKTAKCTLISFWWKLNILDQAKCLKNVWNQLQVRLLTFCIWNSSLQINFKIEIALFEIKYIFEMKCWCKSTWSCQIEYQVGLIWIYWLEETALNFPGSPTRHEFCVCECLSFVCFAR